MWLMRYSTKPLSHDYKVINHVASLLYITVNQTICLAKCNFVQTRSELSGKRSIAERCVILSTTNVCHVDRAVNMFFSHIVLL